MTCQKCIFDDFELFSLNKTVQQNKFGFYHDCISYNAQYNVICFSIEKSKLNERESRALFTYPFAPIYTLSFFFYSVTPEVKQNTASRKKNHTNDFKQSGKECWYHLMPNPIQIWNIPRFIPSTLTSHPSRLTPYPSLLHHIGSYSSILCVKPFKIHVFIGLVFVMEIHESQTMSTTSPSRVQHYRLLPQSFSLLNININMYAAQQHTACGLCALHLQC